MRLALALAVLLLASPALALDVTLAWDASPTPDVGYRVLYGETAGGPYPFAKDAGTALTATVTGLSDGSKYFFVAVAYDRDDPTATSLYSNQVARSFRVPQAPAALRKAAQ